MGFWGKLGKIGLAAAPYVAAPFTGGASLLAAPATSKALNAWNQKDANNAAMQGKAPSGFDRALGMGTGIASNVAGIAGGIGAIKNIGGMKGLGPSKGADFMGPQQSFGSKMSNLPWGNIAKGAAIGGGALVAGKMISGMGNNNQQQQGGIGPSGGYGSGWQNRTPNLESYIQQGRQDAMMNQPWRQQRGIFPQQIPQGMPPWMQMGGGQQSLPWGQSSVPQVMGGPAGSNQGMSPDDSMLRRMLEMRQPQQGQMVNNGWGGMIPREQAEAMRRNGAMS